MKLLLTGITGLVGASFVTATLRSRDDIQIVAICRSGRGQTAQERVKQVIEEQCAFDGTPELAEKMLGKIEVISGDVKNFPVDEIVKKGPYDVFFHCAADVNLGKDPEGKTYATNLEGTKNALELAHLLKVKALHYVSTAYVAGKTNGIVMEGSYERSKFEAEKLVQKCGIPYTIYRPSIIVGRLSDGLIRKPLAFYRIMEFLGSVKKHHCVRNHIPQNAPIKLSLRLESEKSDKIYFVPIDYVQKAISTIFTLPVENKCYHITGESPVSTDDINTAVSAVLKAEGLQVLSHVENPTKEEKMVQRMIEDLMPYFASQITFDNTQVKAALGPEALAWKLDIDFLKKMAKSYYRQTSPGLVAE